MIVHSPAARPALPIVARLLTHIRSPLNRNGYALALSSGMTSVIGVVYWISAAHAYSTPTVGLNSAAISAMMFLSGLSQLNLTSALIRFLPSAGRWTTRLIAASYLVSVVVGAAISLIFLTTLHLFAPALTFLTSSPEFVVAFTLSTIGWSIFVLQDSVLTGLRQAIWVPIENTVFAVAKVVLLIGFAAPFPSYGIFASWTLPLAVILLLTNFLIFRYFVYRQAPAEPVPQTLVPTQVVKYAAADYIGSSFWLASTTLLPVLITQVAGARANAYFYLSWTISYSLYLVSSNMCSSLIVEAAAEQSKLADYSYRVLINSARLVVPLALCLAATAPLVLGIFGPDYASESDDLLRLLAISAIPNIITTLFVSIARVQRRMKDVILMLGAMAAMVITLSLILLQFYGIVGVGIAWLVTQLLLAAFVCITQLRPMWASHGRGDEAQPGVFSTFGQYLSRSGHDKAELQRNGVAKTLPETRSSEALARLTYPALRMLHRSPAILPLLSLVRKPLASWTNRHRLREASILLPSILKAMEIDSGLPPPSSWTVHSLIPTVSDMTVVVMGPPHQPPFGALKLPQTSYAVGSLKREKEILDSLWADQRLGGWTSLLPKFLAEGAVEGRPYAVEQVVPGVDARTVFIDPEASRRLQVASADAIGELHRRTGKPVVVDPKTFDEWVEQPLAVIRKEAATFARARDSLPTLDRVSALLRCELGGRHLVASWIHGDLVPGNILVSPDGATIKGFVDWDYARPRDLPMLDLLQLLLSSRMILQNCEMGELVNALLDGLDWFPYERAILEDGMWSLPGEPVDMRAMILLTWARHVAANLEKSARYGNSWLWVSKNIEAVLRRV